MIKRRVLNTSLGIDLDGTNDPPFPKLALADLQSAQRMGRQCSAAQGEMGRQRPEEISAAGTG
ncbi:hypothetical protein DC439_25595 (plasmid) [Agrobacterium tumefaciens]|nr:hypothetical protein DC439_25595 [Agrobacterium tumefaciens]